MTTQLAILGSPVSHALSPVLHRAAYAALGLDWTYDVIDCTPDRLADFLASLDNTWAGLSLTMPLKHAVVPLLDKASATVTATGAANTVTISGGLLLGENTDVHGMTQALHDSGLAQADSACLLGAGATAATALSVLHTLGCRDTVVLTRNMTHTRQLAHAADRIGISVRLRPWSEAARHLGAGLVISALPPGAADPLAPYWPAAGNTLLDVVYRPWPTPLAQAARRSGSTVIGGLPMLVHQAARQVEIQTGLTPAPLEAMRRAAEDVLLPASLTR
jgi:shikimate dehydrogenase